MVWELIFMMVVLKIPVVYVCALVWWAIRAEPHPLEGAQLVVRDDDPRPPIPQRSRPRRSPGSPPRSGPARSYPRPRRVQLARAESRR